MTVAIGVDLGGTKCLGVVADGTGAVLAVVKRPTPQGPAAVLDVLAGVARELLGTDAGAAATAVGLGVPGLVDGAGVLRFAPNLPGVVELDVQAGVSERLAGVTVRVENDASCAGWGEFVAGAAAGGTDVLLATLGTGIGGGIVVGGRLVTGAGGFAGEIGHMVVDPHGPACPCGKRGCWERYASGSGLGRIARDAAQAGLAPRLVALAGGDPEDVKGEHVTAAADEGDAGAAAVLAEFAWWLALGLTNLAAALDPDRIVLGGGLIGAAPHFLEPTRAAFVDQLHAGAHRPPIPLLAAALGEPAGAIGAALLALEGA